MLRIQLAMLKRPMRLDAAEVARATAATFIEVIPHFHIIKGRRWRNERALRRYPAIVACATAAILIKAVSNYVDSIQLRHVRALRLNINALD